MKTLLELFLFFVLVALGQWAFIEAIWRERTLPPPKKPARLRSAIHKIKPLRLRPNLGRGWTVLYATLVRLSHRLV